MLRMLLSMQEVQLFALTSFREGTDIIACCLEGEAGSAVCNAGVVGAEPGFGAAVHRGLRYEYSGYNGVNGRKGDEFISIQGTTNTHS